MSTSESTASTRLKRLVLVVANPSSDSDSDGYDGLSKPPSSTSFAYRAPSPPSPDSTSPPRGRRADDLVHHRDPSPLNITSLPRHSQHPSLSNPALSSPGTGTSSPPPTTPAQSLPPSDIHDDPSVAIALDHPSDFLAYHQKPPPHGCRGRDLIGKAKSHMSFHRPHHDRRFSSSSSSRQPTSPINASQPQSYSSRGSHNIRSPHDAKTIIMVTGDSDQYHVVDITGFEHRVAAFITELIYSKLRIPDEEQSQYSIYRTDIGAFARGDALTDEQLFRICEDESDGSGNLCFLVASSSAPVHEPASNSPTASSVQPPVLPLPYGSPYVRTRRRSRSKREGSVSSSAPSERLRGDGYAQSVSSDMDDDGHPNKAKLDDSHRATLRPSPHPPYGSPSHSYIPSSPQTARHPSVQRPISPDNRTQSPSTVSPPERVSSNGAQTSRPLRGYKHTANVLPLDHARHDDEGTYVPSKFHPPHTRSGSDAAVDRDRLARSEVDRVQEIRRKGGLGRDGSYVLVDNNPPASENGQVYRPLKIKAVTPSSISPLPPSTPPGVDGRSRPNRRQAAVPIQWVNRSGSKQTPTTLKAYRSMDSLRGTHPGSLTPGSRSGVPPLPSLPQSTSSSSRDPGPVPSNGSTNGESSTKAPRRDPPVTSTPAISSPMQPPPPPNQVLQSPPPDPSLSSPARHIGYPPSSGGRGGPRPIRPLPQSGPPQQVLSPDSGYGTGTYLGPRPQLPPLPVPSQGPLLSPQGSHDPYVRPSSSLGEEPPAPAPPVSYQPYRQVKPGVFSRPIEEAQSQVSTPVYTVRPLPPSHPPPDLIPLSPPTHATRALPIPQRTASSNTHDQAKPSPPRSPASPKSPQTIPHQSYGTLLDVSISPPTTHTHTPSLESPQTHNPSLSSDDITRLNSLKSMVSQHGEDGTFVPTMRPKVSLPPIPPPLPLPQELRKGAVPPPPPLPSHSVYAQGTSSVPLTSHSPPPPPASETPGTPDSNDSESEAGTLWIVRPVERISRGPPLTVTIEESKGGDSPQKTSGGSHTTHIPIEVPPVPQVPPPEPPRGVWPGRTPTARKPEHDEAGAPDSSWASRPNPEDVIDRLEKYFPNHDLDKPVIEASSGGTSPTLVDYPPVPQVPSLANIQMQDRRKHKKSIRLIAKERNSHYPREAMSGSAFANNVARKRSTKLWDSRVEEVTPAQIKTGMAGVSPDSPSTTARKPIFKWVRGELIGKGNFGRVYLAMNVTTGEMIAVKQVEIPRTASDKNDTRQMNVVEALKLESETLKDLDHPNIVQYLGFEETATFLSIFLEYVPGGSIGGCLRKYGRFEENVTKSFTSQILAGLEYLHSKGILHRDMKADNILVEQTGVCKISDFGISKRTDDINGQNVLTAMQGTIFWMAPEVVNTGKRGYNAKVDIWSVGCVVLEMWAGERPWRKEDPMAVIVKLYSTKQAPPIPKGVELSGEADEFRQLCFTVDPDKRPSAAALKKHPYLTLPEGWTFTGFVRQDMARDLEDAETF